MQQTETRLKTRGVLIILMSTMISLFSLSLYAAESLRLSSQQLLTALKQPGLVILDARAPTDYQQGHIKGALNFPEYLTYHNKGVDGRIVQPTQLQTILRNLGINTETRVVIYDNGEMMDAARLFWTLEVYGLKNVTLLNQGYANWTANNLPLEVTTPSTTKSQYIPVINHERLATKLTTLIASKNPNQWIIDARPKDAYLGFVSSAKRFGHIPSATNIPASHNLNRQDKISGLKSLAALKRLYSDIPNTQKIILYCAIGRISTMNYFTLRELGYNVANYDASWKEWGNDFSLPITNETLETNEHDHTIN